MSLEFEKLVNNLDEMARATVGRRHLRQELIDDILQALARHAQDWPTIDTALRRADELADPKHYRSARPLNHAAPLDAAIDAPRPPSAATIIATDGSQILPDRHAAHLYSVINIGGIVYYHRSDDQLSPSRAPEPFSIPELAYPGDDQEAAEFIMASSAVNVKRDLKEIGALANMAWEHRGGEAPLLALLDQRLLYWPIGGPDAAPNEDIQKWLAAMTQVNDSGALLAGYIDRPMTSAVITLLLTLTGLGDPQFDWKALGKVETTGGLTDSFLFSRILEPGQRSKVFVGVSPPNRRFAEYHAGNEVCFFYLNPGQSGRRISRVDVPMWVAKNERAVSAVHALVCDQCRILGDYPYVLARADEIAVIGRQDHEELDFMIDLAMQRHGIEGRLTAKQSSKGLARGGKTRHRV